jgi:hypothetical protein
MGRKKLPRGQKLVTASICVPRAVRKGIKHDPARARALLAPIADPASNVPRNASGVNL